MVLSTRPVITLDDDLRMDLEAAGTSPDGGAARPERRPPNLLFEPSRVRFMPAWLGAGAAMAALGLVGVRQYGWRMLAGGGTAGLLSLLYMALFEPARPRLERITLRLPSLPPELDGLRIGQISDIHLGQPHTARNLAWAVEQMQRERPDVVAITGDLVDRRRAITALPPLLQGLRAPLGVYAIPGNHDHWESLSDLQAVLARCDIPLLVNEHRKLSWNGGELWLVGIDDIWEGQADLSAALHGVPPGAFTLLLAHAPDVADEAARHGIAAQLSGHTHGGHLRLPGLGHFSCPRYGVRYIMGHYQVGSLALYVSRGLGGAPLRLLCHPEAAIITLRRP